MENIKNILIEKDISIKDVLKKMDDTAKKIVFLVDKNKKLEGVITDGDIRRWILASGDINQQVEMIVNRNPKFIYEDEDQEKAKRLMIENQIECIPILNKDNVVISALWWLDFFQRKAEIHGKVNKKVVIMAGGRGTRLEPFTKVLPKPLLPINDKTIVERIMDKFFEYGCDDFYLSINYKANLIKAYFKELDMSYNLSYLEEKKPLGTAGSLYLLKNKIKDTFFVINCDVLIEADIADILKKHEENKSKITLVSSMKHLKVEYGVCNIHKDGSLKYIDEKPELDFLVNTGMYVLDRSVLDDINENQFCNITDIINSYLKQGQKVGIYPISEKSWMDMGQIKELNQMVYQFADGMV